MRVSDGRVRKAGVVTTPNCRESDAAIVSIISFPAVGQGLRWGFVRVSEFGVRDSNGMQQLVLNFLLAG